MNDISDKEEKETIPKKRPGRKFRLLKVSAVFCLVIAAALTTLYFADRETYNLIRYSFWARNKLLIDSIIAPKFSKQPTELTSEDYQKVEHLNVIGEITSLNQLGKCINLKHLNVENNPRQKRLPGWLQSLMSLLNRGPEKANIAVLKKLKHLDTLRLSNMNINDISVLTELTDLHYLDLHNINISDINSLANLTNLRSLTLSSDQLGDITPLAGLTNLKSLTLSCGQLTDISTLGSLTNLESLSLQCTQISDIKPLANLTNLQILTLGFNQIDNIEPLENLQKLHTLVIYGNWGGDISPLTNLANLKKLYIRWAPVSDRDIEELRKALPNLEIKRL